MNSRLCKTEMSTRIQNWVPEYMREMSSRLHKRDEY